MVHGPGWSIQAPTYGPVRRGASVAGSLSAPYLSVAIPVGTGSICGTLSVPLSHQKVCRPVDARY